MRASAHLNFVLPRRFEFQFLYINEAWDEREKKTTNSSAVFKLHGCENAVQKSAIPRADCKLDCKVEAFGADSIFMDDG